jgi:hypothetical protein
VPSVSVNPFCLVGGNYIIDYFNNIFPINPILQCRTAIEIAQ